MVSSTSDDEWHVCGWYGCGSLHSKWFLDDIFDAKGMNSRLPAGCSSSRTFSIVSAGIMLGSSTAPWKMRGIFQRINKSTSFDGTDGHNHLPTTQREDSFGFRTHLLASNCASEAILCPVGPSTLGEDIYVIAIQFSCRVQLIYRST